MPTVHEFLKQRQIGQNQQFNNPGSKFTIVLCSHIWWTELMAYSLLKLGYSVLIAHPWYWNYVHDTRWDMASDLFDAWVKIIREQNVRLAIGGNAAAIFLHPKTGEPIHQAAGIPLVNYWWDDPRVTPPMAQRGVPLESYFDCLRDNRTLNAIWDIDVMEEMQAYFGLTNTLHLPLATEPEYWPEHPSTLVGRKWAGCFLGNYHVAPKDQRGHWAPDLAAWAKSAADAKLADPSRPMLDCLKLADPQTRPLADISREFERWGMLSCLLMDQNRNELVAQLCRQFGDKFVLIGMDWDKFGLHAAAEHSGLPNAALFYANSQLSLNLFGGCVHAGMPLRPFEIAASHGLIFTQYNRELPNLFDLDHECVSFQNPQQMQEQADRVLTHPADFDRVVQAGRKRVLSEHTWDHRMARLIRECQQRFDLPQ